MLKRLLLTCACMAWLAGLTAEDAKPELPADLQKTFAAFANAMKAGDVARIQAACLPHSVAITHEPRKNPEYGQDINIPFAKETFRAHIASVRKDGEGCYLIRTDTSAIWFVETRAMGWRIYKYLDKPIE
jgi:hypothetical protein